MCEWWVMVKIPGRRVGFIFAATGEQALLQRGRRREDIIKQEETQTEE
jgi:hypothetical protein